MARRDYTRLTRKSSSILRQEFMSFLTKVAQKLDPSSFLKLTRANKQLRALAKDGILKTSISLTVTTYEHCQDDQWFDDLSLALVPCFNKKALGIREMKFLHSARFFQTELECLSLVEMTEQGRLGDIGEKIFDLLDFLRVTMIDYFTTDAVVDLPQLLKKYQVKKMVFDAPPISPTFLQSPDLNKLEELDLSLCSEEGTAKAVEEFLLSTKIPKVNTNEALSPRVVTQIVKLWWSGARNFKSINVELRFHCDNILREEFGKISTIKRIHFDLKDISLKEFHKMVDARVPSVFRGSDDCFIAIRDDLQMLKVFYSNRDWTCALVNMEEQTEEDE